MLFLHFSSNIQKNNCCFRWNREKGKEGRKEDPIISPSWGLPPRQQTGLFFVALTFYDSFRHSFLFPFFYNQETSKFFFFLWHGLKRTCLSLAVKIVKCSVDQPIVNKELKVRDFFLSSSLFPPYYKSPPSPYGNNELRPNNWMGGISLKRKVGRETIAKKKKNAYAGV